MGGEQNIPEGGGHNKDTNVAIPAPVHGQVGNCILHQLQFLPVWYLRAAHIEYIAVVQWQDGKGLNDYCQLILLKVQLKWLRIIFPVSFLSRAMHLGGSQDFGPVPFKGPQTLNRSFTSLLLPIQCLTYSKYRAKSSTISAL